MKQLLITLTLFTITFTAFAQAPKDNRVNDLSVLGYKGPVKHLRLAAFTFKNDGTFEDKIYTHRYSYDSTGREVAYECQTGMEVITKRVLLEKNDSVYIFKEGSSPYNNRRKRAFNYIKELVYTSNEILTYTYVINDNDEREHLSTSICRYKDPKEPRNYFESFHDLDRTDYVKNVRTYYKDIDSSTISIRTDTNGDIEEVIIDIRSRDEYENMSRAIFTNKTTGDKLMLWYVFSYYDQ